MECKLTWTDQKEFEFTELIETLWNVNAKLAKALSHLRIGINRNIVECKWTPDGSSFSCDIRINRNIVECKCSSESTFLIVSEKN